MAFNLFGRRDTPAEPEPDSQPRDPEPERRGFFANFGRRRPEPPPEPPPTPEPPRAPEVSAAPVPSQPRPEANTTPPPATPPVAPPLTVAPVEPATQSFADPDAQPVRRGFFDRMRQAVTRTRESFSDSLNTLVALSREVDETTIADLEPLLLAADLGAPTTALILNNLRERAYRTGIAGGSELKELLKSELRAILDAVTRPIEHPSDPPEVIMMVGVNGTGKTTTSGKLAALAVRDGHTALLCAADTFRAAAIEQLEVWSKRSGVAIIKTKQGGDPSAALYDACAAAKARGTEILIVDTAGRLHTKSDLMKELDKMRRTAEKQIPGAPHQTLLVMDATTGQNGLQQARLFTEAARVTGIVLTKLDGTAKGGIVLAIATELKLPVVYVGTGEKMEDLLPFDSRAFIDSLLD